MQLKALFMPLRALFMPLMNPVPAWPRWLLILVALNVGPISSPAQEATPPTPDPNSPRLQTMSTIGMANFVRNRWGALRLVLVNPSDKDREILVSAYATGRESDQYGKRVWVPANSRIRTWFPFLAAVPEEAPPGSADPNGGAAAATATPAAAAGPLTEPPLELRAWVTDVTDGGSTTIATITNEIQQVIFVNLAPREPRTAFLYSGPLYGEENRNMVYESAVAFRLAAKNSRRLYEMVPGEIPDDASVLATYDNMIVAGDQMNLSTGVVDALRGWVMAGGALWIMTESVELDWVRRLVGESVELERVDDTTLETIRWHQASNSTAPDVTTEHEDPIRFRRLHVSGARVEWTVDGWPAIFSVPMGRGRVIFSTIEARGLVRRPRQGDIPAGNVGDRAFNELRRTMYTSDFVVEDPIKATVDEFFQKSTVPTLPQASTRDYVMSHVGYQVPSRWTVFGVLSAFCLALGIAGWVAVRGGHPVAMLGVAPALALGAAGVLYGMGANSRDRVPMTVAEFQIVNASEGGTGLDVSGAGGVYVATNEPLRIRGLESGAFRWERSSSSNETRRQVWVDSAHWEQENVVLPVGLTHYGMSRVETLPKAVEAEATFDERGVVGTLRWPGVAEPSDGLIVFEHLFAPVRFEGNQFRILADDRLAEGQFTLATSLDDEQQRRQSIYRRLLADQGGWEILRPTLYFWHDGRGGAPEVPGVERSAGGMLGSIPLRIQPPPPNTQVRIPQGLLRVRTGADPRGERPSLLYSWRSGEWVPNKSDGRVYLRFEIPEALRPIQLERAEVSLDLVAETRRVAVLAVSADGAERELTAIDEPAGTVTVTVTDLQELGLNDSGEWVLGLDIANQESSGVRPAWSLSNVRVDLSGKANVTSK